MLATAWSRARLARASSSWRLVERDLALGLVELGLVGPGIDLEQQVALLDLGPFLERHLDQVAGDAGPDVHRLDRIGPAGEIDEVGDLALDRLADGHRGRLGGAGWGCLLPQPMARTTTMERKTEAARQGSVAHDVKPSLVRIRSRNRWSTLSPCSGRSQCRSHADGEGTADREVVFSDLVQPW